MVGNDKKNNTYRDDLIANIKPSDRKLHPFFNGIHMQAHHIISAKGMKDSKIGEIVKSFAYDINKVENLVFLPCTLPGACHLSVQPHRGDHKEGISLAEEPEYEYDDDDDHVDDYHEYVKWKLKKFKAVELNCNKPYSEQCQNINLKLDTMSKDILLMIADCRIPLSEVFQSFKKYEDFGCGNAINITEHAIGTACKSNRDHYLEEHPMYKSGSYMKKVEVKKENKCYSLLVGN